MTEQYSLIHESKNSISKKIEAILFIAPGPVSKTQLTAILDVSKTDINESIEHLELLYANRGLRIQIHGKLIQLTTAPEVSGEIERFLGMEIKHRLSRASMEALSIVAYKQPVTKPFIDSIRGVNSDGVIKTLLRKQLIEEVGRSSKPGRPILYSTTSDFLNYFGIPSLKHLPPLEAEEKTDESFNIVNMDN